MWLIATFPSRHCDIDDYPAVKRHLLSFGMERLEQTGREHVVNGVKIRARKKTGNQWFETSDSINYWEDFCQQKIVWGEISDTSKFALDKKQFFPEATAFFMVGNHLEYLLCMFNSKLGEWLFNQIGTTTGMGTNRWKKYKLEEFIIKTISEKEESEFVDIVHGIYEENNMDVLHKIDEKIYELYNFTDKEISFIQSFQK